LLKCWTIFSWCTSSPNAKNVQSHISHINRPANLQIFHAHSIFNNENLIFHAPSIFSNEYIEYTIYILFLFYASPSQADTQSINKINSHSGMLAQCQHTISLAIYWSFTVSCVKYTEKLQKASVCYNLAAVNDKLGSSVSTVSDYGLDGQGSIPDRSREFFLWSLHPDLLCGPPSFLYNGYREFFPRG
jgi:hypothetical protein